MRWLRGIVGLFLLLLGLVWIAQGTMLLPGSAMSGQIQWAAIGLVLVIIGGWLLQSAFRGSGVTRGRQSPSGRDDGPKSTRET